MAERHAIVISHCERLDADRLAAIEQRFLKLRNSHTARIRTLIGFPSSTPDSAKDAGITLAHGIRQNESFFMIEASATADGWRQLNELLGDLLLQAIRETSANPAESSTHAPRSLE